MTITEHPDHLIRPGSAPTGHPGGHPGGCLLDTSDAADE